MFPDLRTFMDRLRADADLVTITTPVDAHLEAAEIHRRVIAASRIEAPAPGAPPEGSIDDARAKI